VTFDEFVKLFDILNKFQTDSFTLVREIINRLDKYKRGVLGFNEFKRFNEFFGFDMNDE
jgi:hypothetical protein